MSGYFITTPLWLRKCYPQQTFWDIPLTIEPTVYITFDDGPHPTITPHVLNILEEYNAKASFFCVGNNVRLYPDTFTETIKKGHTVGNHTYDHVNGWHTDNYSYLKNIARAHQYIPGHIFRPPYGRIKHSQMRKLQQANKGWKVYMWSLLSGDFDTSISAEQCTQNVLKHLKPGDIVVFHDSEKAWDRMHVTLPKVLDYCREKGWKCSALPY